MRRSTDDRGISREKTGGIPPSLTSRGRGRSGQASVPLSGVPLPSGTFTAMGGRRRGFPTFLSAGARRGVGGWAAGALMFAVGLLLSASPAAALTKAYKYREDVAVIANNVFPYNNPAETYQYYSLPFCPPGEGQRERQRFGELLVGDRKVGFGTTRLVLFCFFCVFCLHRFSDAIKEGYYFEFFIDDLPAKGPIGQATGAEMPLGQYLPAWQGSQVQVHLYPHINFIIGYNGDRIVSVRTEPQDREDDPPNMVDITNTDEAIEVEFTYSVKWQAEDTPFTSRLEKLAGGGLLPGTFEIHWLSIINSFVLVLILTVFLGIILLRVIKNDFTRYMDGDEDDIGEEESGWKLIHGDVFRFPRHVNLFAALTGAGAQLCVVMVSLLLCALLGVFRPTKRGSILTCILVLYSMTAWVAGLMSARCFCFLSRFCVNATLGFTCLRSLWPAFVPCFICVIWQSSTAALPFYPVVVIVAMFVFIAFPLTVVGAIVGRNMSSDFKAPCRTTRVPRQVPKDTPWYRRHASQMVMSGFLPFSAIYIELHYIFASVWGHQIYTLFGILILAFLLLLVVCSFITVALIYFQLGREDHRWWWRSFFSGGSTGLFVYAYSFFYFFNTSDMNGLLQSSFYFGYMAVISYAFFIMLGFVGFMSSLTFVKHIYSVVKCD
eukprot:jgi/Undpi1/12608/HiC_scaffold_6.g02277.m1